MIEVLRFGSLLGAIIYGLMSPGRAAWRTYFLAQLFSTVTIEAAYLNFDGTGPVYAVCYLLGTAIILGAQMMLAFDYLRFHPAKIVVTLIGIFWAAAICIRTGQLLGRAPTPYQAVQMFEAFVLIATACVVGLAGGFCGRERRHICSALCILWMTLAGFRIGFVLNISSNLWMALNVLIPTLLVVCGFFTVGWQARKLTLREGI